MSDDAFDRIMGQLDPPMTVVTTVHGGDRAGCLVGFHSQAGMAPDAFSVWLSKANHTYRTAVFAERFAVHFLRDVDRELARLFGSTTGDDVDKLARCDWDPGPGGVPVLAACAHWMVGRKLAMLDAGVDHVALVLEPEESSYGGPFRPLRLSEVSDLEPGHGAEEAP